MKERARKLEPGFYDLVGFNKNQATEISEYFESKIHDSLQNIFIIEDDDLDVFLIEVDPTQSKKEIGIIPGSGYQEGHADSLIANPKLVSGLEILIDIQILRYVDIKGQRYYPQKSHYVISESAKMRREVESLKQPLIFENEKFRAIRQSFFDVDKKTGIRTRRRTTLSLERRVDVLDQFRRIA